jgi:hypothetical protein
MNPKQILRQPPDRARLAARKRPGSLQHNGPGPQYFSGSDARSSNRHRRWNEPSRLQRRGRQHGRNRPTAAAMGPTKFRLCRNAGFGLAAVYAPPPPPSLCVYRISLAATEGGRSPLPDNQPKPDSGRAALMMLSAPPAAGCRSSCIALSP